MSVPTAHTVPALREVIGQWRADGLTVGFVPTMGALHEGHLSLIRIALEKSDRVVASIFVNPKQFAPHEDFDAYPRTVEDDLRQLTALGAHLAYLPEQEAIYPEGYATHFTLEGPALGLETDFRPHFFNGIAAVVTKLFNQIRPDITVFGEKDYQQLCMIRQLVKDLDFEIEVIAGPLVRDEHGLALSSRNAYLSADELATARLLNKILFSLAEEMQTYPQETDDLLRSGVQSLYEAGFDEIDYLELREEDTLAPLRALDRPARILTAGWVGKTRLLDNVPALKT